MCVLNVISINFSDPLLELILEQIGELEPLEFCSETSMNGFLCLRCVAFVMRC